MSVTAAAARSALKGTRKEADRCFSSGDHVGAFVRLSHALKQAEAIAEAEQQATATDAAAAHSSVAQILSQRSRCLLKMGNHYLALEDGRRLAEMDPGSLLGHQRCAEVFQDSCHFSRAHDEYLRCFQLSDSKKDQDHFMDLMKSCKRDLARERTVDERYPWVGAGVGIVVSVAAVVADQCLAMKGGEGGGAYVVHPVFQALIVVAVSLTCYFFASRYRRFMVSSRDSLIERPVDLLQELRGGGGGHEEEEEGKKKQ